jgi:very-short-patch-repair endonuclease
MDKFLSFLQHIIDWFVSFLHIALTGKPYQPSKRYTREEYYAGKETYAPVSPPPQEKQAELYIETDVPPEYRKYKSLLTFRERELHRVLRRANDNEFAIMLKVRMGDFIYLANLPLDRKTHNNKILCKHVDFLFCDKFTLEPLLVVELDDSSHKQEDRIERDKFKDETFRAVGLPCLRIELQEKYDWQSLQKQIKEKIGERPDTPNWN